MFVDIDGVMLNVRILIILVWCVLELQCILKKERQAHHSFPWDDKEIKSERESKTNNRARKVILFMRMFNPSQT